MLRTKGNLVMLSLVISSSLLTICMYGGRKRNLQMTTVKMLSMVSLMTNAQDRDTLAVFLYAGADTNYVDSNGEHIFVGDVIEIIEGNCETQLALGYFPYFKHEKMRYCFVLDNHSLSLEDCVGRADMRLTRIGTTFFQLDPNFETEDMNKKVQDFNGWHDTN